MEERADDGAQEAGAKLEINREVNLAAIAVRPENPDIIEVVYQNMINAFITMELEEHSQKSSQGIN
jgi:hypothetical protein